MSDKTAFPSDTADKVLVRMPDGMRDLLKSAAKKNNRTMNAEIVARLERTFSDSPAVNGISMSAIFEKLEEIEASIKTGKFPGANPFEQLLPEEAPKRSKAPSKSRS